MSEKIIGAELRVDTNNADASVKQFNDSLKDTSSTLNKTNTEAEKSTGHFANLKNSFSALPGPIGQATESVSGLSSMFKILLANPVVLLITAIVGALTLLYKAFASTNDGAEKIDQIFSGIGAALNVLRDRVLKIGDAIVKFFKGDFKGALEDAKSSVNGISDEIVTEFKKAEDATRRLQEAEDELSQVLSVSRAKLNRDLASTKELITDETASYKDRKDAIDKVRDAEGKQTELELENAKKTLQAIKDKNALSDTSDEDLQKEADAQSKIYAIEEQSSRDIRNLNRQSKAIDSELQRKAEEEHAKYLERKKQKESDYSNYVNQLSKLQEDNYLASITDSYVKQLRQADLNYKHQADANKKALEERHLTQEQYNNLDAELTQQLINKQNELYEQHQKDVLAQQEAANKKNLEIADQQRKQQEEAAKQALANSANSREYVFTNGSLDEKAAAIASELALYKDAFDAKTITEKEYTDKVEELANKRMQISALETEQRKQEVNTVSSLLTSLTAIVGKQTIAGKALGIATALINTWQGASEALKQKSTLPSPFDVIAKIANVAAVVATGLNTVREITKVNVPGGGGGSTAGAASAVSAITPPAPITPTQQNTTIDADSVNAIGSAVNGRSYVLSSDIEHDLNKQERLNRAARLGG